MTDLRVHCMRAQQACCQTVVVTGWPRLLNWLPLVMPHVAVMGMAVPAILALALS